MTQLTISIYTFFAAMLHPFYMSVTEINHNAKNKTIEISCHIFTDDLEGDFKVRYKKAIDLVHPADKAFADSCIKNYLDEKLRININGKVAEMFYLGYEINEDAVWCYFECRNVPGVTSVKIYNAILYNHIPEQSNLIHFTVNGKRQSTKLENPKAYASFSF